MTEAIVAITIELILPAVGMELWRWYDLKFNKPTKEEADHD
jgi:hypothetical protein